MICYVSVSFQKDLLFAILQKKEIQHIFRCNSNFDSIILSFSLLIEQPYLSLMTNTDGDNWEEWCSHISNALWLSSPRGSSLAAGKAAECGKFLLKTAPMLRWLIDSEDRRSRSIHHGVFLQLPWSKTLFISVALCYKWKEPWGILRRQGQ